MTPAAIALLSRPQWRETSLESLPFPCVAMIAGNEVDVIWRRTLPRHVEITTPGGVIVIPRRNRRAPLQGERVKTKKVKYHEDN